MSRHLMKKQRSDENSEVLFPAVYLQDYIRQTTETIYRPVSRLELACLSPQLFSECKRQFDEELEDALTYRRKKKSSK